MLSSAPYLNLKITVFRPNIEGIFQPSDVIAWAPWQEEKTPEPNTEDLQGCLTMAEMPMVSEIHAVVWRRKKNERRK